MPEERLFRVAAPMLRELTTAAEPCPERPRHEADEGIVRLVENDVVKMQIGFQHPPLKAADSVRTQSRMEVFDLGPLCGQRRGEFNSEGFASISTRPDDRRRLNDLAHVHKRSKPFGAGRQCNPVTFPRFAHGKARRDEASQRLAHSRRGTLKVLERSLIWSIPGGNRPWPSICKMARKARVADSPSGGPRTKNIGTLGGASNVGSSPVRSALLTRRLSEWIECSQRGSAMRPRSARIRTPVAHP